MEKEKYLDSTETQEMKDSLGNVAYTTEKLTHLSVLTQALMEISQERNVSLNPRVSEIADKLEEYKLENMEKLLREMKKEIFDSGLSTVSQAEIDEKCKKIVEGTTMDKMRKAPIGDSV